MRDWLTSLFFASVLVALCACGTVYDTALCERMGYRSLLDQRQCDEQWARLQAREVRR